MIRFNLRSRCCKPAKLVALVLLGIAAPAAAQLLGRGGLPQTLPLPQQLPVGALTGRLTDTVTALPTRLDRVTQLLRDNPRLLDRGEHGEVVVRSEVLAVAPSPEALAAAKAAGFGVVDDSDAGLGLHIVTLKAPGRLSTRAALALLRKLDPAGSYDLNPIFTVSGVSGGVMVGPVPPGSPDAVGVSIGLIDGGVAVAHPALAGAAIEARGFAGATSISPHGTAVASLLVGRAPGLAAAAVGARLYAADVYGAGPTGGNARAIVAALAWLAGHDVGVVNISLVGPPNLAMAAGVRAVQARGSIVVAAVGNEGPAAAPLYPAAYPGVVAVTALDGRGRLLPEAGRADHVDFAAPGVVSAADPAGGLARLRGTSFAAPLVAGRLARLLPAADVAKAPAAIAALARDGIAAPRR